MLGQMQNHPLLISSVIDFAARHQGDTEVVSRRVEGDIHRYTWADVQRRAKQVAKALDALGNDASPDADDARAALALLLRLVDRGSAA